MRMELKLSDNTKLRFLWNARDGSLEVQAWRPMFARWCKRLSVPGIEPLLNGFILTPADDMKTW
jgi:hypothetical protein